MASLLVGVSLFVEPPPLGATQPVMKTRTEQVQLVPRLGAGSAPGSRRGILRHSAEFLMIGLTVDEVPDAPIRVRSRSDGRWSPWFDVSFSPDGTADGSGDLGHVSEPLWMGPSDAYEVDAPARLTTANVHLVSEELVPAPVVLPTATAGATTPSIIPRSSWGARAPKSSPSYASVLKLGIVHHSAGGNTYSASQVPSVLRGIQAYHMDAQGWDDFAYNFAVDRFGRTWEGRAGGVNRLVIGGHSHGFNTGSVGVVVLGEFTNTSVPSSATSAVSNLLSWKLALHNAYPGGTVTYTTPAGSAKYPPGSTVTLPRIIGHRDVQITSCPGTRLYAQLGAIRTRVAQLWPGHRASTVGRDTVGRQSPSGAFVTNSTSGAGGVEVPFGQPGDRVLVGDWNGDGIDTLGVRRGAQVLLTNDPRGGAPTTTFTYGLNTDRVLVGDWNGDGLDTIGVRRDASFHLRDSNTSGGADHSFAYGVATDVPVVGDWDGNVTDTIGVRRGATFLLRNTNSGGAPYRSFGYGVASDRPVIGDWDGNGVDSPGVVRLGTFHLRNQSSSGPADVSYAFGSAVATPITGDWDGR